jgi:ATP-dependent DNA helicase PIF1
MENIGITAMTGAAAVLIGGTTLHSYLGIGLGIDSEDDLVKKINNLPMLKNKWNTINTLVIDEVSMLSSELFSKLNNIAKRVRMNKKVFGGIQLILGGDFLQLPCIKGDFCFESETWKECNFEIFNLTCIMRQHNKEFQDFLNRARFGELTENDYVYITRNKWDTASSHDIEPTRIMCENIDVDRINTRKLDQLPTEYKYNYKMNLFYYFDKIIKQIIIIIFL